MDPQSHGSLADAGGARALGPPGYDGRVVPSVTPRRPQQRLLKMRRQVGLMVFASEHMTHAHPSLLRSQSSLGRRPHTAKADPQAPRCHAPQRDLMMQRPGSWRAECVAAV